MDNMDASIKAGKCLRFLIEQNYSTQEEFALEFGAELRTVNRWINQGISKIDTIQEIAHHFGLTFIGFFSVIV